MISDIEWYWALTWAASLFLSTLLGRLHTKEDMSWYRGLKVEAKRHNDVAKIMTFKDTERLFETRKNLMFIQGVDCLTFAIFLLAMFKLFGWNGGSDA